MSLGLIPFLYPLSGGEDGLCSHTVKKGDAHVRAQRIGRVTFGEGMPKICVPIMGKTREALVQQAQAVRASSADVCEWRADFFLALEDDGEVERALCALRGALGDMPLLFTVRTLAEGGRAALSAQRYAHVNALAARHAQMVDVELFAQDAGETVRAVQEAGACALMSSHDFEKTPPTQALHARIERMRELGADMAKLAVTPQSPEDVLRLLYITHAASQGDGCPIITMSMGRLGAISRISGGTFGSVMTFGCVGEASAPGQMDASSLRAALTALDRIE